MHRKGRKEERVEGRKGGRIEKKGRKKARKGEKEKTKGDKNEGTCCVS
jgi:hypothetical protein